MDTSRTAADRGSALDASSSLADVFELAQQLRVDSVRCSTAAGSGHPTSGMSAADVMAVLMTRRLRYDWRDPRRTDNDHLIFSKGHASPLLYAMFKAAGVVSDEELIDGYRRAGSRLEGHPTPALPWVDAATGSLGQGIGIGVGLALAARLHGYGGDGALDNGAGPHPHVWALCGDSEMAEGSVWEALDAAGRYQLGEFTVIVDVNRLGQRGPTELQWDLDAYARRAEAFGCAAVPVDGHDVAQVDAALERARRRDRPVVILAKTRKGRGFSEVEDKPGWHGKPLPPDMAERAIAELGGERAITVSGLKPEGSLEEEKAPQSVRDEGATFPTYSLGDKVAARRAFGDALVALQSRPDVVVMDAEVGNSTYTEAFAKVRPERFYESYIAEQQMIAASVGLSVSGFKPFAATFAAFLTRAYDFIRMAAVTGADLALCGSHCGVEIGEDGPSQMGLEDLAMMRAVHGSTVLYPSDATSAAALTVAMADLPGISYLRATRGAYPVLYESGERFPIGGSKTLHTSDRDQVTLLAAGVTVHECLKAREELAQHDISARVIDLYSVKPLDADTVIRAAEETDAVVVVEDHHPEGGLGEAVLASLAGRVRVNGFGHLAVSSMPDSRSAAEQLDASGISAPHIVRLARELLTGTNEGKGK
ncbi:MAG: transketolase [Catenulisporales bacterium]|nr:transketolase [Catenulisporales bacterium]